MKEPQSVGFARGWAFRVKLGAISVCCLLVALIDICRPLEFMIYGIPATIENAYSRQKAPTDWDSFKGQLRSSFGVKIKASNGYEGNVSLYLPQEVVKDLLNGQKREIIVLKDNPKRWQMKGEPFPLSGIWWGMLGLVFYFVFRYSLNLS